MNHKESSVIMFKHCAGWIDLNSMKVMMLHKTDTIENSPLSMEDLEIPEPGPNQVLVKEIAWKRFHKIIIIQSKRI